MKKFFSFFLAVFLILTAVNVADAAKDKAEKILALFFFMGK